MNLARTVRDAIFGIAAGSMPLSAEGAPTNLSVARPGDYFKKLERRVVHSGRKPMWVRAKDKDGIESVTYLNHRGRPVKTLYFNEKGKPVKNKPVGEAPKKVELLLKPDILNDRVDRLVFDGGDSEAKVDMEFRGIKPKYVVQTGSRSHFKREIGSSGTYMIRPGQRVYVRMQKMKGFNPEKYLRRNKSGVAQIRRSRSLMNEGWFEIVPFPNRAKKMQSFEIRGVGRFVYRR